MALIEGSTIHAPVELEPKKKKKPDEVSQEHPLAEGPSPKQTAANLAPIQPVFPLQPPAFAGTPIDVRVQNFVTGYWNAFGRIPSPKKIMDGLSTASGDETAAMWTSRFRLMRNAITNDDERVGLVQGDMGYDGDPSDGIDPEKVRPVTQADLYGPYEMLDFVRTPTTTRIGKAPGEVVNPGGGQLVPKGSFQGYWMGKTPLPSQPYVERVLHMSDFRPHTPDEMADNLQLRNSLQMLTDSRAREFGFKNTDPFVTYRQMIFGRAMAAYFFGDAKQKEQAIALANSVTPGGMYNPKSPDAGQRLFGDLKLDNPDAYRVIYDGWIIGRPAWQTVDEARLDYARQLGTARMPQEDAAIAQKEFDIGWELLKQIPVETVKLAASTIKDVAKFGLQTSLAGPDAIAQLAGEKTKPSDVVYQALARELAPPVAGVAKVLSGGVNKATEAVVREVNKGLLYALAAAEYADYATIGQKREQHAKELGVADSGPLTGWHDFKEKWMNDYGKQGSFTYALFKEWGGVFDPNKYPTTYKMADFFLMAGILGKLGRAAAFGAEAAGTGAFEVGRAAKLGQVGAQTEGELTVPNLLLRNNAEAITLETNGPKDVFALKRVYNLPDDWTPTRPGVRPYKRILVELTKSKNVDKTEALLRELADSYGVDTYATGPALAKELRLKWYLQGQVADQLGLVQNAVSFATLSPRFNLEKGADTAIYHLGQAFKMGKGLKWTAEDAAEVQRYASRMFLANSSPARKKILEEFLTKVRQNAGADWEGYQSYRNAKVSEVAQQLLGAHGRSYEKHSVRNAEGKLILDSSGQPIQEATDFVVPTGTNSKLMAAKEQAKADFEKYINDPDANPKDVERLRAAMEKADAQFARYEHWAKKVVEAERTGNWTPDALAARDQLAAEWGSAQPFGVSQLVKGVDLPFDPLEFARYMRGPLASKFELFQARTRADQIMRAYKELVMSSMGFPARVVAGDEFMRLFPEGTMGRTVKGILTGRGTPRQRAIKEGLIQKRVGVKGEVVQEAPPEISGRLYESNVAMDWVHDRADNWVPIGVQDPRHFQGLSGEVRMFQNEPLLKKWFELGRDNPNRRAELEKMITADTDEGAKLRLLLQETHRATADDFATPNVQRWLDAWVSKLERIEQSPQLRYAYEHGTFEGKTIREKQANYEKVPKELLDPVNVKIDPILVDEGWHIPVVHQWTNRVIFPLLGRISRRIREMSFSDNFYLERAKLQKSHPNLSPEQLTEIAAQRALDYTDSVQYTHNVTVLEDSLRNMAPFIPAYRQFALYWGKQFARNPLLYAYIFENYPLTSNFISLSDLAKLPGVEQVAQTDVGKKIGKAVKKVPVLGDMMDYSVYVPSAPFWAITPEEQRNFKELVKQNFVNFSPLVVVPFRAVNAATGGKLEGIQNLPGMTFTDPKTPVISWADDLLWGTAGINLGMFSKDKATRDRVAMNIMMGQLANGYKPNLTAAQMEMRGAPFWYKAMKTVGIAHPEALFSLITKLFNPFGTVTYNPKPASDYANALYEWKQAGADPFKQQKVLDKYPVFKKVQEYYNMTPLQQEKWKLDPANANYLIYVESKYNYLHDGTRVASFDDFAQNLLGPKTEEQYLAGIQQDLDAIRNASNRAEALAELKKQVALATDAAQAKAKQLSGGNKAIYQWLMAQWHDPHIEVAQDGTKTITPRGIWASFRIPTIAQLEQAVDDKYPAPDSTQGFARVPLLTKFENMLIPPDHRLLEMSSAYSGDIEKYRAEYKQRALKNLLGFADEADYEMDSFALKMLGVPADNSTDSAILRLQRAYLGPKGPAAMGKQHGYSSKEYKEARNNYLALKRKLFASVPGGKALAGGLPENMSHIPYFTKLNITIPESRHASKLQNAVDYLWRVGNKEHISKAEYDKAMAIAEGFKKMDSLVDGKVKQGTYYNEMYRIVAWNYILAEAKYKRNNLKTGWSDWYNAPGNSVASKEGQKAVKDLNAEIAGWAKLCKPFADDLKTYFGRQDIAYKLLAW